MEVLNLIAGAEERQQELRVKYVYRELQENWRLDPYGRKIESTRRTKTFDVVLVNGARYRKLIERNGTPLTDAEKWEVEQDMLRVATSTSPRTSLRDLAQSHQLSSTGNALEAMHQDKAITLTFDPVTFALLRQATLSETSRMLLEYVKLTGEVHLPSRMEVVFTVSDVHGLQISTFSEHRKIDLDE